MINFNNTDPQTISADSLFAVITDPAAAKKALAGLVEKQKEVDASIAENNVLLSKIQQAQKDAEAATDKLQLEQSAFEQTVPFIQKQLQERADQLDSRHKELNDAENYFNSSSEAREAALVKRESEVSYREKSLADLEKSTAIANDEAKQLKSQYEAKLAALKNAIN